MKHRHWFFISLALGLSSGSYSEASSFPELTFRSIQSVGEHSLRFCEKHKTSPVLSVLYWLTPTQLLRVQRRGVPKTAVECELQEEYRWRPGEVPQYGKPSPGLLIESYTAPQLITQPPPPRATARSAWTKKIAAKPHDGERFVLSGSGGKLRPAAKNAPPCSTRVWQDFTWLVCEDTIHLFHRDERIAISNTGSPSSDVSDEAPRIRILLTFQIGPQTYYVIERRTATGDDFTVPVALMKRAKGKWRTHLIMEHFEPSE